MGARSIGKLVLDKNWQFCESGHDLWREARVPGCVHMDLWRHGLIEDPFHGVNEKKVQWIDKRDYEYRCEFSLAPNELLYNHLDLTFLGLDTYADIFLNGVFLMSADNMFCALRVPVKELLRNGANELRIVFKSPIRLGLQKLEEHGYALPATNDQSEAGEVGECKVSPFTRKAPYHYGWDWGPRLVTSGIWQPIELEMWNDLRIEDVVIRQSAVLGGGCDLDGVFMLVAHSALSAKLTLTIGAYEITKEVALQPGVNEVNLALRLSEVKLWWPNGLGTPHLYAVKAAVHVDGDLRDLKELAIGIRTIEVVQAKDAEGRSFYFKVNGVPVFAKGANYIPCSSFPSEVHQADYERVVGAALDANMNMLRVWGGGYYEKDVFYDVCDRMGIMLWQDFMFACSMYPSDDDYCANVSREVIYNVKRLRNHPSIVLWCGNNEIDAAWSQDVGEGWGWRARYEKSRQEEVWQGYRKLFVKLIPELLTIHDPTRFYWSSSPQVDSDQRASLAAKAGDIHYWGVWHGAELFSKFDDNIGRFVSEYGFQSFPDLAALRRFAAPSEFQVDSDVMKLRQKSPGGNQKIHDYMAAYYRVAKDFTSFLYLSQLLQAEGIKAGVVAHRRHRPFCMGSLVWQLNDCWPAISWSSLDYYGNWKALHYFLRSAFATYLVAVKQQVDELHIHIVSDAIDSENAMLQIRSLDFAGNVLYANQLIHTVLPLTSAVYCVLPVAMLTFGVDERRVLLDINLKSCDGRALAATRHYFVPPKELLLEKASCSYSIDATCRGVKLTFEANQLMKNVYLSMNEAVFFSDNYFDVVPGYPVEVFVDGCSKTAIEQSLQVMSLVDSFS